MSSGVRSRSVHARMTLRVRKSRYRLWSTSAGSGGSVHATGSMDGAARMSTATVMIVSSGCGGSALRVSTAVAEGDCYVSIFGGLANTPWLSWWPINLGRSWLVETAQLGPSGYAIGGLVWPVSGLAFASAALGLFGVPGLRRLWQPLALVGGGFGLLATAVFFRPLYAFVVLVNLAVLATRAGTERSRFVVPA